MAVGIVDRQKLVNIADAVRAKKGITGNMTLDAIASNITSMPTADNNAKFDFSGSGSKSEGNLLSYLTTVDLSSFDTSNYTSMDNMFQYYSALKNVDVSGFNTSKVTNMGAMFSYCSSLTSLDLSNFNTSKVTNMGNMFLYCSSLTSLDVSGFDTSKVTDMGSMFKGCSSLNSLDLNNWNTSKVGTSGYGTSFKEMFNNCSSLESLDISSFDLSNTFSGSYYSLIGMFYKCNKLKTLKLPNSVSFNKTDIYLDNMFYDCNSLESLDLTGWDTTNVVGMSDMFYSCWKLTNLTLGNDWASNPSISSFSLSSCPLIRESAVDVINKLATRENSPVIKFKNRVGLYQSEIDIATNKGWSVSGCTVLVDAETATVGQYALIDGVVSKCVYVADTPQDWGQRIFASQSYVTYSNGKLVFQWGGYGTATGITETAIGTGLANTNALLAMNLQSTDGTPTIWDALKEFRSTYGDRWFIASLEESSLYIENVYWTSSEVTSQNAYTRNTSVQAYAIGKNDTYNIYPFTYV